MSKCGRNELKTRQYDSVKCPARAVLPSREPGTCMLCHSIS